MIPQPFAGIAGSLLAPGHLSASGWGITTQQPMQTKVKLQPLGWLTDPRRAAMVVDFAYSGSFSPLREKAHTR